MNTSDDSLRLWDYIVTSVFDFMTTNYITVFGITFSWWAAFCWSLTAGAIIWILGRIFLDD